MLKIITAIIFGLHGLVHLLGYSKAFNLGYLDQLSQPISKFNGVLWLFGTFLFVFTGICYYLEVPWWWVPSAFAVVISQYLIITSWQDARFGTIVNVVIVSLTVIGYATWHFYNGYRQEVRAHLDNAKQPALLTEGDIENLPQPVQKYVRYTGAVGQPRVTNFKVAFQGQLRKNETLAWMPFTSEQHNFIDPATRLFFLNATMKHLPVGGFHSFSPRGAVMDIRLLSLFKVQYQAGLEMDIAETVTFFNDMCVMAPATLIDERIKWLMVNDNSVKAEFRNNGIAVSAWLYFNNDGQLVNFVSDDRYATTNGKMKQIRWSTPMKDYRDFGGIKLASYAEAIYSYPDGDLTYGVFKLEQISYNVTTAAGPGRKTHRHMSYGNN